MIFHILPDEKLHKAEEVSKQGFNAVFGFIIRRYNDLRSHEKPPPELKYSHNRRRATARMTLPS